MNTWLVKKNTTFVTIIFNTQINYVSNHAKTVIP